MDALILASSGYPNPPSFANTHFQSPDEDHSSILVQEQGLNPPFTPSSPSLDMEAALEHLSSGCDSELSSGANSSDDTDVLMVDPFLDYLNGVLMEERDEDDVAPCNMGDDVEASYNAIMSSLYDIVSESLPLDSTSSKSISASDSTIQANVSGFQLSKPWDKSSLSELHASITESKSAFNTVAGVSSKSVPALGKVDVWLEEENTRAFCAKQAVIPTTSSEAHDGSLETAHVCEYVAAGAINDFSSNNGGKGQDQEQTRKVGLLPLNYESPTKPSSIDISLEEFEVRGGYTDLYAGKPTPWNTSMSNGRARCLNEAKVKLSRKAAYKASQSARNVSAEAVGGSFLDLKELLVSCAQAVAIGDVKKATEILQELYQVHGVSLKGNSLQRTAHYFCDALIARMGGMGGYQYRILSEVGVPTVSFLRAAKMWYEMTPFMKILHYFVNQNILKAAEGAWRLHILDYGMSYGMQWPCLINALAEREGGPPLLVITGIDCSKPGLEWLEENGRRLAAYAKTSNVPFQFHAIVSDQWEDIDPASLYLQEGEVRVINCAVKGLSRHGDESTVDSTNNLSTIAPREKLLMNMRSLNPRLLLTAELNLASNSPFFVTRFREAFLYYSNVMNMLDALCGGGGDDPDRLITEMARSILNIVACEGAERVERPETYRRWDALIKRAGFELLPIPSVILSRSRSHAKQHYHKDFMVHDDANGWLLLGWKGRIILSMFAWKPATSNRYR
ncbi:hypothetical protein GOP47_0006866 [Adiantum capillus-veneris]|uniref:Uncharacterized protein n=1 Tax=Adiantum capillus-veneris TaxID=13818 RepID=A0A9D4ZNF2_ADICA|nr:hypothetical protein GOP47_0006866 [Adiantum capillus-veneris]